MAASSSAASSRVWQFQILDSKCEPEQTHRRRWSSHVVQGQAAVFGGGEDAGRVRAASGRDGTRSARTQKRFECMWDAHFGIPEEGVARSGGAQRRASGGELHGRERERGRGGGDWRRFVVDHDSGFESGLMSGARA